MFNILRQSNKRNKKPSLFGDLDNFHPLYRKMRDCVIFNEKAGGTYTNLAKRVNYGTGSATIPAWDLGRRYTGVTTTQTRNLSIRCVDSVNYMAGDFTLRILFMPNSLPNLYSCLISKVAAVDREFSLFFNTSGDLQYYSIGGGPERTFGAAITVGLQPNKLYDLVLTGVIGSMSLNLYVNGVLTANNAAMLSSNVSYWSQGGTTNPIGLGTDPQSAPSNYGNYTYYLYQSWVGRALNIDEIRELYWNPFSFTRNREHAIGLTNSLAAASVYYSRRNFGNRLGTRTTFY